MIELESPQAVAAIHWIPAHEGGRRSGPPTAPVYAATAVFQDDPESPLQASQPYYDAALLSVLIRRVGTLPGGGDLAHIGFLVPELAEPLLYIGAKLFITEGPKIVAHGTIRELLHPHTAV